MALSVSNNNGAVALSANGNYCAIAPPGSVPSPGTSTSGMFSWVRYTLLGGSSGVGTVATFQEQGTDGTWRALATPAPITAANNTAYNGTIQGPLGPVQIAISGLVGNGYAYAQLSGMT